MGNSQPVDPARAHISIPWWEQNREVGLGDVVSKVTKAVGIKECGGCKRRRKALNRLLKFGGKRGRKAAESSG